MQYDHPINKIQIPLDAINDLLDEFDGSINSKRIKSQITTISELIRVLWNRNLFYSDAHTRKHISKYIACDKQRDIIHEYITSLITNEPFNGPQNVYGNIFFMCLYIKCSDHFESFISAISIPLHLYTYSQRKFAVNKMMTIRLILNQISDYRRQSKR